jgi:DNA-directed RNA polymerase subunit RPC12/RpoP
MPITFDCAGCGKAYTVPDELGGRSAKCKQCNTVSKIPMPPRPEAPEEEAPVGADVVADDPGEVPVEMVADEPRLVSQFSCPSCAARLKLAQPMAAGKRIRCPKCSTTVTVQADAETAPEDASSAPEDETADPSFQEALPRKAKKTPRPEPEPSEEPGDEDEEAPRKRIKKPKKPVQQKSSALVYWIVGGSIAGVLVICLGCLGLLFGIGAFGSRASQSGFVGVGGPLTLDRPAPNPRQGDAGADTVLSISAEQLTRDFNANTVAAERKYCGKPLEIDGTVYRAELNPATNDFDVVFRSGNTSDGKPIEIFCCFEPRSPSFASVQSVKAGQQIKIKGTIPGVLLKTLITVSNPVLASAGPGPTAKVDPDAPKVTNLAVERKDIIPCMKWADSGGSAFLTVDKNGVLRKLSFPEGKELKKAELECHCDWLDVSGRGILLTVRDRQEIWMVDPNTFQVTKKIEVPKLLRAVSAPSLSIAVAGVGRALYVVDLETANLNKYEWRDEVNLSALEDPVITPNGQYLITHGGSNLARFRIVGGKLRPQDWSQGIIGGVQPSFGIQVSYDSRWVAYPTGAGNHGARGAWVFSTESFKKPEFALEGVRSQPIGFDPAGSYIYTAGMSIFSAKGILKKECQLGDGAWQLLVHPQGNKLVVLGNTRLQVVEVPSNPQPDQIVPVKTDPTPVNDTDLFVKELDDLKVATLPAERKDVLPCLKWADADGTAFLALNKNGILRKLSFPEGKELKKADLERKCDWLDISNRGMLVTLRDRQEVWLLDSDTLQMKKKYDVPKVLRAVSAPNLSIAVAGLGRALVVIDLDTGKMAKYEWPKEPHLTVVEDPVVTPNGKYLITHGGSSLVRFQILENKALKALDYSQGIIAGAQPACGIQVSGDSKLVAYPTGAGNHGANGIWVFSVESFRKPEFSMEGVRTQPIGFDPAGGNIYVAGMNLHSAAGILKKRYNTGDGAWQHLVHPGGNKLLILGDNKFMYVEVPKK